MNKKIVVEVSFTQRNGLYTAKLKALHNGSHLIAKDSFTSSDKKEIFDYVSDFITKHDATDISCKRGMIEDSFAKYLTETQTGAIHDDDKEIEGVLVDSVPDEHKDTLVDLRAYKQCLQDTVRHKDYVSLLFQGVLYNNSRSELHQATDILANPFEATVSIPLEDKKEFHSAINQVNEIQLKDGNPTFKTQKFNRVTNVESKDYKLTVHFE